MFAHLQTTLAIIAPGLASTLWLYLVGIVALVALISLLYLLQLQSIKKDVFSKAKKRGHSI